MDEDRVDRNRVLMSPDAKARSEGAPSKRLLARLLPETGPSWWELAAVAVAFTLHRFAVSTFYARLGVSPEEVGVGTTSALEGAVLLLAVLLLVNGGLAYLYGLMFGGDVLALWHRIKVLRAMPERGRLLATVFVIHRLVVVFSIIAFVVVLGSMDADRQVGVGPWEPELATLVLLGFGAFWVALSWLNKQILPVATTSERDGIAVRRAAGRFTTGILGVLTIVLLVAPTFMAYGDADAVKDGQAVSRNLYQVTPVIVTPMADAADVLRDTTSNCLLYLGHADGITVLYDADAGAILRLPSSHVMVTDPQRADDAPASPCGR